MTNQAFAERLKAACQSVIDAEGELTEIDSHFGDADHGLTMSKIAGAILSAADPQADFHSMLESAAEAVMKLNGGSAVPLWNTLLDGMAEAAPESNVAGIDDIKKFFANGYAELEDISGAKVGDKTMMDALIPAAEAIVAYSGDSEDELFAAAAAAAVAGAENSKNFASKYGRAKSYGAKTIGTPDAGALSMSYFFKGLAKG